MACALNGRERAPGIFISANGKRPGRDVGMGGVKTVSKGGSAIGTPLINK